MGIFNIKSLKDKYAWGSSENKTNPAETTEEQQTTTSSPSANIADGVRSLIKSNPELAGKNRRGVARTITPDGSLREAIEDYEVRSPAAVASQEVTPEEELSADGTATVSAQPLTHTNIEATPGDILDVDGKPTGPSIIRVGQHNAPTVDAEELADPEEANSQEMRSPPPLLTPAANAPRCSSFPPKPSTVPATLAVMALSKLSSSAPETLPVAHPARSFPSTLPQSTVWKTSGFSPAQAPAPSSVTASTST